MDRWLVIDRRYRRVGKQGIYRVGGIARRVGMDSRFRD